MTCAVGSLYQGTTRMEAMSGRRMTSGSMGSSTWLWMNTPVTVWPNRDSGRRRVSSRQEWRNLSVGRILPRGMPDMSQTRHSSSEILLALSQAGRDLALSGGGTGVMGRE